MNSEPKTRSPRIYIKGHQRSGNNLLVSILATILYGEDYDKTMLSDGDDHCLLAPARVDTAAKYIYIHRKCEDVLKSVFRKAGLWGIRCATYQEFLTGKYRDFYSPDIKQFLFHIPNTKAVLPEVHWLHNPFFSKIDATPGEWHANHVSHYLALSRQFDNVRIVQFENLLAHKEEEVKSLCEWLGISTSHVDLTALGNKTVGWIPADEYVGPSVLNLVIDVEQFRNDATKIKQTVRGYRQDLEGRQRDLETTRHELENTRRNLESARLDFEDARQALERYRQAAKGSLWHWLRLWRKQ